MEAPPLAAEAPGATRPAIGIDIGGTGLKVGLIDLAGEVRVAGVTVLHGHADESPDVVVERMAAAVRQLAVEQRVDLADLAGIGLGCAGLVDEATGVLHTSPNLPAWRDVPLRDELARRLPAPVVFINDAQAFLEAEWRAGAARGALNALFVTLGTGVGGGLVIDGRPFRGRTGLGGEIGHMTIDYDGVACPCGNRGCLERYVARDAVERLAAESGLAADGAATPAEVARRAQAGEPRAIALFAEIGRRLGAGLAGLVNLLEPEVIVVGGGIAGAGALLLDPAAAEMTRRSMVARRTPVALKQAFFGAQAGMIGAALVAADPTVS